MNARTTIDTHRNSELSCTVLNRGRKKEAHDAFCLRLCVFMFVLFSVNLSRLHRRKILLGHEALLFSKLLEIIQIKGVSFKTK